MTSPNIKTAAGQLLTLVQRCIDDPNFLDLVMIEVERKYAEAMAEQDKIATTCKMLEVLCNRLKAPTTPIAEQ